MSKPLTSWLAKLEIRHNWRPSHFIEAEIEIMKQLDHVVSSKMWQTSVSQTETKHPLAETYPQDNIYKFGSLPASTIVTSIRSELTKAQTNHNQSCYLSIFGQVMSSALAQWRPASHHAAVLHLWGWPVRLPRLRAWLMKTGSKWHIFFRWVRTRQKEVLAHLPVRLTATSSY